MREIAPEVWQLRGFPRDLFNVYLVGDTLIDAGTRWAKRRILRQLRGRTLRRVALTHCHPDHQGAARAVCQHFDIPLACHEADVPAMEGRAPRVTQRGIIRLVDRLLAGPSHPVSQVLRDGDMVGGLRVVHAPGHTPGHVIFFRESDRVAIAGDVLANLHFITFQPGLREPVPMSSFDPVENRRSMQILRDLRPSLVCFGHGPPLTRPELLEEFVARNDEQAG